MHFLTRLSLLLLFLLTTTVIPAHAQLGRLHSLHAAFWNAAFGNADWTSTDIGFVAVKHAQTLHVVRLDGSRDTVASFPVCAMGLTPGFKVREGDGRTPEGIYHISLLNPASSYHLSMKINYPNRIDDARHARHSEAVGERWSQGGDIFIHGKCASVGCIAMTDDVIEKLYLLVASRSRGQRDIPVLILPYDDEAAYQQMFFHADEQHEETGKIYWLLLREHIENMRDLWRYIRDTGNMPPPVATSTGRYRLPRAE
jgi:hypothetical protein